MTFNDMPNFTKSEWDLFGTVEDSDKPVLEKLLKKYKCKARYLSDGKTYVDNIFRIDSIRLRLWGHRWATYKNWIDENPELKDFDPRKRPPLGPRCQAKADARKQKR